MLAAVRARNEVLPPVFYPPEWTTEFHREPSDAKLFRLEDALVAETTADVWRYHSHASLRNIEVFGNSRADHVRDLCRCVDDQLVGAFVPVCEHRLALKRVHDLTRGAVLAANGDGRACGGVGDAFIHFRLQNEVVCPIVVD